MGVGAVGDETIKNRPRVKQTIDHSNFDNRRICFSGLTNPPLAREFAWLFPSLLTRTTNNHTSLFIACYVYVLFSDNHWSTRVRYMAAMFNNI